MIFLQWEKHLNHRKEIRQKVTARINLIHRRLEVPLVRFNGKEIPARRVLAKQPWPRQHRRIQCLVKQDRQVISVMMSRSTRNRVPTPLRVKFRLSINSLRNWMQANINVNFALRYASGCWQAFVLSWITLNWCLSLNRLIYVFFRRKEDQIHTFMLDSYFFFRLFDVLWTPTATSDDIWLFITGKLSSLARAIDHHAYPSHQKRSVCWTKRRSSA